MIRRIDRLSDNDWAIKDSDYVTIRRVHGIEDKIEFIRELLNKELEVRHLYKLIEENEGLQQQ